MIEISKPPRMLYHRLIALWEASVRATHDFLEEEDILYFRKKILEEYFDKVDLYIASDENATLLGFLGLSSNKIEMLFIDPEYRTGGIGKLLVEYAKKNHHVTLVDVNEQNVNALGFYLHLGFKIINRNPHDGEGRPFPILEMQLE